MNAGLSQLRSLPNRYGRRTLVALALIAALGLSLRAAAAVHPVTNPADDSHAYYALSKALYEEWSFGGPDFENSSDWSPGAPWLYAAAYVATGPHEGTARMVEALFGVATIIVCFLLGWRLGGRLPALLSALGVAIYPPFIHSVGELTSEPPAMVTLPAAVLAFLWASEKRDPRLWVLSGFLFGLTAMFRPEYLAVAGAFVLLAAFHFARHHQWRPGGVATGLMIAALLLPITPWTVRNYVVLDRLVPISTGGGKALYVGTFYPADGEYQQVKALLFERQTGRRLAPHSEALDQVDPTPLFNHVADRYSDMPRDSALGRVGKENFSRWFSADPIGYTAMTLRKIGRMWSSGVGAAMGSAIGRLTQIILVALALAGIILLGVRRRWWDMLVVSLPTLIITGVGAASLAAPRRNEVLMTLVLPLAAFALSGVGYRMSPGFRGKNNSS